MTIEGGDASFSADENQGDDVLSMIVGLTGGSSSEAPTTPEQPTSNTPDAVGTPAPSEPVTPDTGSNTPPNTTPNDTSNTPAPTPAAGDETDARRNAILREIAMDPLASQQYAQQQYYPQQAQQQFTPQAQQQPQAPLAPELPFDDFTFDPSNPQHTSALVAQQIQQVGAPLFEAINAINQRHEAEEQQRELEQFNQVVHKANQTTVNLLDTYVPGFSGMAEKLTSGQALSAVERAVFNEAVNAESAIFEALEAQGYEYVRADVQMRAKIAQQIGPHLTDFAKQLGLVAQPSTPATAPKPTLTPDQQRVMRQEAYIESSNAVPADTTARFDKAHKEGDTEAMIWQLLR